MTFKLVTVSKMRGLILLQKRFSLSMLIIISARFWLLKLPNTSHLQTFSSKLWAWGWVENYSAKPNTFIWNTSWEFPFRSFHCRVLWYRFLFSKLNRKASMHLVSKFSCSNLFQVLKTTTARQYTLPLPKFSVILWSVFRLNLSATCHWYFREWWGEWYS